MALSKGTKCRGLLLDRDKGRGGQVGKVDGSSGATLTSPGHARAQPPFPPPTHSGQTEKDAQVKVQQAA